MQTNFAKVAGAATLLAALAAAATMSLTSADPTPGALPASGGGKDNSGGNTTCVVMGNTGCLAVFDASGKRLTVNETNKAADDSQLTVCLPGTGMGVVLKGNQVDGRLTPTFVVLAACAGK